MWVQLGSEGDSTSRLIQVVGRVVCSCRAKVTVFMLAFGASLSSASRGHLDTLLAVPFLHFQS